MALAVAIRHFDFWVSFSEEEVGTICCASLIMTQSRSVRMHACIVMFSSFAAYDDTQAVFCVPFLATYRSFSSTN